jgi:hypothetical protein
VNRRLLAALTAAALVTTGCGGGSDEPDDGASTSTSAPADAGAGPRTGPQYVALGDSYAAAPGVPTSDEAGGCFRSSNNYAQLLAAQADLPVTDVTCSGATTDDVLEQQLRAITSETELVTVGIGGNDFDLFTNLVGGCAAGGDVEAAGTPCTDRVGTEVAETVPRIARNIERLLDAVVAEAPEAQVVVVGYPDLLPASGSCPELVPLAAGDYPLVNGVTRGLSDALEQAAAERDLDFVDVGAASEGHDICSAEPWVNGAAYAEDGTIPFHPLAAEQEAVADLVAGFL